jgi:hypothetical protein
LPSAVPTRFGRLRIASVIMFAASSGVSAGKRSYIFVGAIIGVLTSGMYTVVMWTPSPMISEPIERLNASSAAFDAR